MDYILNKSVKIGNSHQSSFSDVSGICQDAVQTAFKNDVHVIALSDGCGSSPASQFGSEITVKTIVDLFTSKFDELYNADGKVLRKTVVLEIISSFNKFYENNPDFLSNFKKENVDHYNSLFNNWKIDSSIFDKLYPYMVLDATVQFVATKNGKVIFGRLGDGVIAAQIGSNIQIISMEKKDENHRNATWYPSSVIYFDTIGKEKVWSLFEVIKGENIKGLSSVILFSDGLMDVLTKELDNGRYLVPEKYNEAVTSNNLDNLLDSYNDLDFVYDDISIASIILEEPKSITGSYLCASNEKYETVNLKLINVASNSNSENKIDNNVLLESIKKSKAKDISDKDSVFKYNSQFIDDNLYLKIQHRITISSRRELFIKTSNDVYNLLIKNNKYSYEKLEKALKYLDHKSFMSFIAYWNSFKMFQIDKSNKTISRIK